MTDRVPDVQAWLEDRAEAMAGLLTELVAIPTENPPGRHLGRCADLLRMAVQELGFDSELIKVKPARQQEDPAIVRATIGAGAEVVYYHGHFDVVPAQNRSQFDPRRSEGRIYGRGTADMKGGLVSMLYGAAAAAKFGLLNGRRVILHFVCDEETGSTSGSGHLRSANLIDPEAVAMLTAEPTGGVVWHANRGAITLRVDIVGKGAHVGQVHLGVNAFEHMIRIAEPLAALSHELLQRKTAFRLDTDEARGSMLVVGGQAGAGVNFNVVPGAAWFSVDRRFNPEEDLDQELERLTTTITDAAAAVGAEVKIEVLQRQPSGSTAESHAAARFLSVCVGAVEGSEPPFEMCPGVLDTRWYAQLGIPAFAYGPGRLDVSHGPEEFIDTAAMGRCAAVYAYFAGQVPPR